MLIVDLGGDPVEIGAVRIDHRQPDLERAILREEFMAEQHFRAVRGPNGIVEAVVLQRRIVALSR